MGACPYCQAVVSVRPPGDAALVLAACTDCLNPFLLRRNGTTSTSTVEALDGIQRVEDMAPPGSVMAGVFEILGEVVAELPALPHVPQRVLSLIHDPLMSMGDLAEIINEDATISMKVLRVSNSAFYANVSEITDLQFACARLGVRTVANIVHAIANGNLYRAKNRAFQELGENLWSHAVATAHAAEELSKLTKEKPTALPFIAGLVHDIGKLVLLDAVTVRYEGNVGQLRESPELLTKVLDRFHPIVGLHVVQHWRMPPEFGYTTYFSALPDKAPLAEWTRDAALVGLASDMATACGYGLGTETVTDPTAHPAVSTLGLEPAGLEQVRESLPPRLDELMQILGAP